MRDLNVCKTSFCPNLGVSHAPDYEYNTYYLGFRALHCHRCGSNPPMLDNHSFNLIIDFWQKEIGNLTARWCPRCGSQHSKRFGYTNHNQRHQCLDCGTTFSRKVFTPQLEHRLLGLLEWLNSNTTTTPESHLNLSAIQVDRCFEGLKQESITHLIHQPITGAVATMTYSLPFNGGQCWVLISTCATSGSILWLTPMCMPVKLPSEGVYNENVPADPVITQHNSAIKIAEQKEEFFLQRPQFDLLNIGKCQLRGKQLSAALPVLTAHSHFYLLARLGHGHGAHILEHEVFLRGACVTQFAQQIKQQQTAIYYLIGRTSQAAQLTNTKRLGWWRNLWCEYVGSNGEVFAQAQLCGKAAQDPISLNTTQDFINYITPYRSLFATMVPQRAINLLFALAKQFNDNMPNTGAGTS